MVTAIITGLGFGIVMSVLVGPVIFAIIKYSISYGWKAGMSFVMGVSISDIMYVSLASWASGMLSSLMLHEKLIGYIGGGLLFFIGLYSYFKKIKVTRNNRDVATVSTKDYWKIFASGFFLNTLNPGIILTWITAVAAIAGMNSTYKISFFGSWLGLLFSFDVFKVMLAQKIRTKLTPRNIVYITRISALCITVLGLIILIKIFFDIKIAGH